MGVALVCALVCSGRGTGMCDTGMLSIIMMMLYRSTFLSLSVSSVTQAHSGQVPVTG